MADGNKLKTKFSPSIGITSGVLFAKKSSYVKAIVSSRTKIESRILGLASMTIFKGNVVFYQLTFLPINSFDVIIIANILPFLTRCMRASKKSKLFLIMKHEDLLRAQFFVSFGKDSFFKSFLS